MGMEKAPIVQVFPLALDGTREQIERAVWLLLQRPQPSSFAVTADSGKEGCILRLSRNSYKYLQEVLEKEKV